MLKVQAKNLETVSILSLQGQFVRGETEILHDAVQSLSGTSAVILDLAQVSKVDAHGLGVMLELREQTQANGIRFELMNISKPLSTVLEMTHLDSVFRITPGVGFFSTVSSERRESLAMLKPCA
jgi:anti-anti-sigma factor